MFVDVWACPIDPRPGPGSMTSAGGGRQYQWWGGRRCWLLNRSWTSNKQRLIRFPARKFSLMPSSHSASSLLPHPSFLSHECGLLILPLVHYWQQQQQWPHSGPVVNKSKIATSARACILRLSSKTVVFSLFCQCQFGDIVSVTCQASCIVSSVVCLSLFSSSLSPQPCLCPVTTMKLSQPKRANVTLTAIVSTLLLMLE